MFQCASVEEVADVREVLGVELVREDGDEERVVVFVGEVFVVGVGGGGFGFKEEDWCFLRHCCRFCGLGADMVVVLVIVY